ncbi:MAG: YraN family protein [Kiritimatiellae bacterium]|nr:YraN family protein [Kiritimatiellia bacterium]
MPRRLDERPNVGRVHGAWGEDVAVAQLEVEGLVIIERNVRPCKDDKRIEIDAIAYDRKRDILIFVEVKQHAARSERQSRLRSLTKRKQELLRRGCRAWILRNKWQGAYRFDVIEVYGVPDARAVAEVDHIRHVRLFADREHFVNWEE